MSEMEPWDLAPGEPISPDFSLREFRYSQFSECPSAPFNTAEPEYLDTCSASLDPSPFLEPEGHTYSERHNDAAGASGGISDAFDDEIVKSTPECGEERLQFYPSCSDSLGLSLFDDYHATKVPESSPRRIYCDPRLLEEETQVEEDVGVPVPTQQPSHLPSPIIQQSEPAPQATAEIRPPPLLKEAATTLLLQERYAAVEDAADISQRWHNRRRISLAATTGLTTLETPKQGTPSGLNADQLEAEKARPASATTSQKTSTAVEGADDDIVQRWHNRKRIALSTITNLCSPPNTGIHKKLKEATHKSSVEFGVKEHPNDKENWSIASRQFSDTISPSSATERAEGDANLDGCDSRLSRRKLHYSSARDIKSLWQPATARNEACLEIPNNEQVGMAKKPKDAQGKWACPRKNRPRGRQRTIDAWIK